MNTLAQSDVQQYRIVLVKSPLANVDFFFCVFSQPPLNRWRVGDTYTSALHTASSATGQPCLIRIIAWRDLWRLHVCNIVVTEVNILYVWSWLVVTRDICYSGDGILLSQHLQRQHGDEAERLPPLVAHQTHGALIHYLVQSHQALVPLVLHPSKVVLQIGLQLPLLLTYVREVNEEA